MKAVFNKIWPQSLFARLLWVWLMGLALVLAAAAWLALDERLVRGQVMLHVKVTQELAASADWLDTLSPEQRALWMADKGKRRARWRLEPPTTWTPKKHRCRPMFSPLPGTWKKSWRRAIRAYSTCWWVAQMTPKKRTTITAPGRGANRLGCR